ncbi:MAG: AAA family ATPase [Candidatus Thiodiazotropha sp.]
MYHEYFGISEDPFSITPDTRYLFLSERHRNAFAHLLYGVSEGGGFVQLTGEVGTGKTLLCRNLLAQLPDEVNVALIFNPRLTPLELVASICDELGILYPLGCDSIKEVVDFLNAYLLESHGQGRRTVVIIDEAQNLSFEALEQVRLLTNLETEKQKLLQIILVGQPELKRLLERPDLRQLAQRITARYHLTPLSADETRSYVLHRLHVAGLKSQLFTPGALQLLYKQSGGIPRLINVLSSRAMLAAYGAGRQTIDRRLLKRVAGELAGEEEIERPSARWGWAVAGLLLLGTAGLLLQQSDRIGRWFSGAAPVVASGADATAPDRVPAQVMAAAMPVAEAAAGTQPPPAVDPPAMAQHLPAAKPSPESEADTPAGEAPPAMAQAVPAAESLQAQGGTDPAADAADAAASPETPSSPATQTDPTLSLMGMLGERNNAFATLFGYWQRVYPTDDETLSACERAERVGLSCIYGRGGWQNLVYYNRPAVIELLLDDGHRYQVVVTRLQGDEVTLDLESRRLTFTRREIDPLWTGSYIVLWRPPKLTADTLSQGAKGRDVAWLISMLDRVEGVNTAFDPDTALYDEGVKARVMKFQRSQDLMADGIVGKKTIIQLSLAVDDGIVPVLTGSKG